MTDPNRPRAGLMFCAPPIHWLRDYRSSLFVLGEKSQDEKPYVNNGGIADVQIKGVIQKGGDPWFGETDPTVKAQAIRDATNDPEVKAILIRLDSPGGSVDGMAELADAIKAANSVKPTMAQVEGMAASAAYWAASQAGSIHAGPLDVVGSIGVYSLVPDDSEYWSKAGVKWNLITTGEHKAAGAPGQPVTDNQLAEFSRMVGVYFDAFKGAVKTGRGLDKKAIDAVADGRLFIGPEAKSAGLIDKVQSTTDTIAQLTAKLARSGRTRAAAALALMDLEFPAQSRGCGSTDADAEPDANTNPNGGVTQ